MEFKQREKEGNEEGLEQLSYYWLKFKIDQVKDEWKAEKFIEYQKSYGMSAEVRKATEQAESEQEEHEPHVEVNKEKHISQANTKPILETDVEKPSDPENKDRKTHNNLIPMSVPPHNPAPNQELCDQT